MGNYQEELMELMVKKILSKYDVKSVSELSDKEKKKVKKVVKEIRAEVEKFLENENKLLIEKDFKANEKTETLNTTNPFVGKSGKENHESNNDLSMVKTFLDKAN